MSAEPSAPTAGDRVGSYHLLREIGRGGMGSVWTAEHRSLGRTVAVKFIDAKCDGEDARRRFEREAVAAARIRSRHVVHVYDHGIDHGRPYIVMELLVGESLGARLERTPVLPLGKALGVLTDIGRALTRAHSEGVVHRDLKPDNVFLCTDEDTGEEYAKVLDFGIAKLLRGPGDLSLSTSTANKTQTGTLLGTPFYMSPEQARGATDIDARSDLWAMGVIACQCLAGSLPFAGASLGDLLVKICTATPTPPSHLNPKLPSTLDAWLARALEKDPEQRFTDAAQMLSELGRVLQPYVVQTSVPSSESAPPALYAAGSTLPLSTPIAAAIDPLVLSRLQQASGPTPRRVSSRALYALGSLGTLLAGMGLWAVLPNDTALRGQAEPPPKQAVVLSETPPPLPAPPLTLAAPAPDAGTGTRPATAARPRPGPRPNTQPALDGLLPGF